MTETIILQRVLPHYRIKLFERLYQRFGWKVVVASNPPGGTFLNLETDFLPFVYRADYHFPISDDPWTCEFPFDRIIEDLRPQRIISEFSMRTNASRALFRLRRSQRIKSYALWSHGWNMERGFDSLTDHVKQYARLPFMAPADMLLTYSDEGKAWLSRWLPWKRVLAIGNTLDIATIRHEAEGIIPAPAGCPQFLSVGRLTKDKCFAELIRIFAALKRDMPNAKLTIIGDGPERQSLQGLIDELNIDGITLPGAIYGEQNLAPHFLSADLFLLPGAAGLSVNHALAYNLPVIAYARGRGFPHHHPEIAYVVPGVTGMLCMEPGERAMVNLIRKCIVSGLSTDCRRRIPDFVNQNMLIDNMIEQFWVVDQQL